MILDATAGNRTMWECKNNPNVIYLDMEKRLEIKPTIFADHRQLPFKDEVFDTIFYDPPHYWGNAVHYFSFPNRELRQTVFPDTSGIPTYYGWDKYKTKSGLIKSIYQAQKEFWRVLKKDGLLWLKWNELAIELRKILAIFNRWRVMMTLYIQDPTHTAGKHQTYWVCLCKDLRKAAQTTLM